MPLNGAGTEPSPHLSICPSVHLSRSRHLVLLVSIYADTRPGMVYRSWRNAEWRSLLRLPPSVPLGDLSWGTEIKERLNCKMFGWFLEHVYPELFIPGDPKFVVATGSLRNPNTNICLDTLGMPPATCMPRCTAYLVAPCPVPRPLHAMHAMHAMGCCDAPTH